MKKNKRQIEEELGISLDSLSVLLATNNYKGLCKLALFYNKFLLIIELCNDPKAKYKWGNAKDILLKSIVTFLNDLNKIEIDYSQVDLYDIVSIQKELIAKGLGIYKPAAADILGNINNSNNSLSKMISDNLIKAAQAIRAKKIKAGASLRMKPHHIQIVTDFLNSKKGFEEFVLSQPDQRLTVAKLQRILLDCEIMGMADPKLTQSKGFTLRGYLRSLDNFNVDYVLFEHEEEVLETLDKYTKYTRKPTVKTTKIEFPFVKGKYIYFDDVIDYCRRYYPKAYEHALEIKKQNIEESRQRKRNKAEEAAADASATLYQTYKNQLENFGDFLGDSEAFIKQYSISPESFDRLINYLKIKVPEQYEPLKSDIDEYCGGIIEDYIADIMEVQDLYQALGQDFLGHPEKVQTFLYEYAKACKYSLPELLEFIKIIKSKAKHVFEENRDLLFPTYTLAIHLCGERIFSLAQPSKDEYGLFDIKKYFMTDHIIDGLVVRPPVVEHVINILKNNGIPTFSLIVETAIIRYCKGQLEEYMAELPINSDHMKLILSKRDSK